MRHYENLVIVKPTLTEEEIKNNIAAIEAVITDNGGAIIARDEMGMRKLAYPIEKTPRGYFHVVYYTIDPSAINEIERRFRINEELMRFVTIKYDSKREVKAWHTLVEKTNKAAAKAAEAAQAAQTPAAEPAAAPAPAEPAPAETAPVAEAAPDETPSSEENAAS